MYLYWFILLFPLLIYPWGYDPNYTMPKAVYLTIFVLGTWLYIILKRKYWTINLKRPYQNVEFILLVFIFFVGISTVFSVDIKTSLNGFIHRYEGTLAYFCYCSIFLFSFRLFNVNKLEKVIRGMALISIFISVYAILQHYSIDFFPRNSSNLGNSRSYGFFDNPNFFGSYLVLVGLLSTTIFFVEKSHKIASLYFISSCLSLIALIFSGTRSGWLGTFLGFLLLTALVFKSKYLWKKWTILVCAFSLIMLFINFLENGSYLNRVNTVVTDTYHIATNNSTGYEGSNRFFIWEKSVPLIKTYFWTGSGPDTFAYVFRAEPKELEKYFGTQDIIVDKAHNEYLQMAITLGIPALLTYLFLLFFVIKRAIQAFIFTKGRERIFILGLITTIVGYLAQAFFNISVVPVAPLFWSLLGITLAKSESCLKMENVDHYSIMHNQSA